MYYVILVKEHYLVDFGLFQRVFAFLILTSDFTTVELFIRKTRKMRIHDVSSVVSCTMGGSKIYVVLQDISNTEDIIPVFQVFLHGAPQPNLQMLVNQPEKESGSDTWFSFYSPPQQHIKSMPEDAKLRLIVQVLK